MRSYEFVSSIDVTLNDDAFTDEFMSEFQRYMMPFTNIAEHGAHLAQLAARGFIRTPIDPKQFVEGYGDIGEFVESIIIRHTSCDESF